MHEIIPQQSKNSWNENIREIELKDPLVAGILAWLVPGLGHLYQRRFFKGILFGICIIPLLLTGIWMGSYSEPTDPADSASAKRWHIGRNVYCSWRNGDKRLYFIPQALIGGVAIPAILQANHGTEGESFLPGNAFVPPRLANEQSNSKQPTLNQLIEKLHSYFELGTIFTVIAGLLNILAILDALGGPVWIVEDENQIKQNVKESNSNKA